jgi:hypothetical protein
VSDGAIDMHAHFLPPAYRDALAEAELWMIGGLPVPEWSPELALAFMDAHGIASQALSISRSATPASSSSPIATHPRSPVRATTTPPS